jgi:hypothetical protein
MRTNRRGGTGLLCCTRMKRSDTACHKRLCSVRTSPASALPGPCPAPTPLALVLCPPCCRLPALLNSPQFSPAPLHQFS